MRRRWPGPSPSSFPRSTTEGSVGRKQATIGLYPEISVPATRYRGSWTVGVRKAPPTVQDRPGERVWGSAGGREAGHAGGQEALAGHPFGGAGAVQVRGDPAQVERPAAAEQQAQVDVGCLGD